MPAPAIQDTFDLDVKREDSSATDAAALNAVQGTGAGGPMSLVDTAGSNIKPGESSSTSYENIQPKINQSGAAVHAAGSNGGVLKADTIVNQTTSITNADQQTVSSTSSTSNVITFDNRPGRNAAIRARFAV